MRVVEIVRALPATLAWMVLFDLTKLRPHVGEASLRAMFGLSASRNLDTLSHVVLTSAGTQLAPREGTRLASARFDTELDAAEPEASLSHRFSTELDVLSVDGADCLAVGQSAPFAPVVLHITIEGGYAQARALFADQPCEDHYELLQAVGVEYLGGEHVGDDFVAHFRNTLPTHVEAGELAHFSRTGHCNLFFLRHGAIDAALLRGLLSAASSRVASGAERTQAAVGALADEALRKGLALTCHPPSPTVPYEYGDVVPLGFLLAAAKNGENADHEQVVGRLRSSLQAKRRGALWSYHTGGLATSTDSVLVLQADADAEDVEALEQFADGAGGYLPQISADVGGHGVMLAQKANRHWRQSDFATTCLVRALRQRAGLDEQTSTDYVAGRFETRSGLYFANPYLVDWALALSVGADASAGPLRERLAAEILASMNQDHSFGTFDIPLSSAYAILALSALGHQGRTLRLAQLRLLNRVGPDGVIRGGTPFYSTRMVDQSQLPAGMVARAMLDGCCDQVVWTSRQLHAVSLFTDDAGMIATSATALALSAPAGADEQDAGGASAGRDETHPRYRCRDHGDYIRRFALPPYLPPPVGAL